MLEVLSTAVRAVVYASALTGAGNVFALASLRCEGGPVPVRLDRVIRLSGLFLAAASCLGAIVFLLRLGGIDDEAARAALFGSPLGAALALQALGGLLLAATTRPQARRIGAAGILLAFGVVGHAASRGFASTVAVILHVSAAAWWLGGLLVLLRASRVMDRKDFASLTARFSRQAVWIVGLLIAAGITTAALVLEFKFDPGQRYTQMLLVKVVILAGLLVLAGSNKFVLSPRIAETEKALRLIRRTMLAETGLVAAVFVATAFMTTNYSPHTTDGAQHTHDERVQVNGPITVIAPWAPAMFKGAQTAAGYMVIVNRQNVEDRLLSASSPWAEHVTLHATTNEGNISKMDDLAFLEIAPGQRVAFSPGVYHLMFTGLYAPFVEGDDIPVSLQFAKAGNVDVTLRVRPFGEIAETHQHEH